MIRKNMAPFILLFFTLAACQQPTGSTSQNPTVTDLSVTVTPDTLTDCQLNNTVSLSIIAAFSDGTTKNVSTTATIIVDEKWTKSIYKLTAIKEGSGTITVSYGGKSKDMPYKIVEHYESLKLYDTANTEITNINATIGDDLQFVAKLTRKAEFGGGVTEITANDGLIVSGNAFFYEERPIKDSYGTISGYENWLHVVDGSNDTNLSLSYKSQSVSISVTIPTYVFSSRRLIPEETLKKKAISYSGYRSGQSPENKTYPSEEDIKEDLTILKENGFGFLRLYDTSEHAYKTLKVIKDNNFPFKVQLGIWIAGSNDSSGTVNWDQIMRALDLITNYNDIIVSISVGNECMVDWNTWASAPPEDIRKYIQYARSNVLVPVTTDDNWKTFAAHDIKNDDGETGILVNGSLIINSKTGKPYDTEQVAQVADYLAIHTYPIADSPYNIWDWKQEAIPAGPERGRAMMNLAIRVAKKQYQAVRDHISNDLGLTDVPVIIGETGWKHMDTNNWTGRSHPVNAKIYYEGMNDWVYGSGGTELDTISPWVCFYFEAFNEPWKKGDDGWGLWDKDRNPTYTISGEGYTDDDINYYGK